MTGKIYSLPMGSRGQNSPVLLGVYPLDIVRINMILLISIMVDNFVVNDSEKRDHLIVVNNSMAANLWCYGLCVNFVSSA